jgi:hypothetical protein
MDDSAVRRVAVVVWRMNPFPTGNHVSNNSDVIVVIEQDLILPPHLWKQRTRQPQQEPHLLPQPLQQQQEKDLLWFDLRIK